VKVDVERYVKINYFKTTRTDMKYLKCSVGVLVFLLAMQVEAKETLKKDDPKVISLCDKNGDNKIKGREYLCYLDLKKKRANDGLKEANEEGEKLDKDITGLDKDIKKLKQIENLLTNK